MKTKDVFKTCSMCGKVWPRQQDFLLDPRLSLVGYQAHFTDPEKGLILFDHHVQQCGTTLALKVETFDGLYQEKRYFDLMMSTEECPGYCLDDQNFKRCENLCRMAFAREIVHLIHNLRSKVSEDAAM